MHIFWVKIKKYVEKCLLFASESPWDLQSVLLFVEVILLSVALTIRYNQQTPFDMKFATALSLFATASAFAPATKPARNSIAIQETKVRVICIHAIHILNFDQIPLDWIG